MKKHFLSCLQRTLWGLLAVWLLCQPQHVWAQRNIRAFAYQAPLSQPDSFPNKYFINADTLNPLRKKALWYTSAGGYTGIGTFMALAWYSNEDLSKFHFFDDLPEWRQFDKAGHALGGYTTTRWLMEMCRWSGMPKKQTILVSSLAGFGAMSSIELFDGFGAQWGASVSDIGANFIGASLAATNMALWNEQRLMLKFSYMPSPYVTNKDSLAKYKHLFGSNPFEWVLKDYNGDVVWLSCRVNSFLPEGKFKEIYPDWLNLAVGYGIEGMNSGRATAGYRQGYLSFDVDLSNIKTKYGPLRTALNVSAMLRVPMPALQFDKHGVAFKPLQ